MDADDVVSLTAIDQVLLRLVYLKCISAAVAEADRETRAAAAELMRKGDTLTCWSPLDSSKRLSRTSMSNPKAVAKISDDVEQLLAFYDFPAEHWIHLRTTNPIESTFATVRNRSKITKGPGSRAAGIAMAYKLIEAAQSRWRAVNAPHLVALVRGGAKFKNGKLVERPDDTTATEEAA